MKERKPLITVGIPFYNAEDRILYAVKSVFAQTLDDWELILIDDGSIDGSIEYVRDIKDPRVIIIRDDVNRGLAYRLNQIIDMAKGKYIARMDADDLMHPERLERQVEYMEKNPDVDVVDTDAVVIDKNLNPIGFLKRPVYEDGNNVLIKAFKYGCVLHPSVLAKSEWYKKNKYDTTFRRAEDRELFIRTFFNTTISHLPFPLHFYSFGEEVRLKAFLLSYKEERKVIKKYGPEMIGVFASIYLYLRSLIKTHILVCLKGIGLETLILKNKFMSIREYEIPQICKLIEVIKEQKI